MNEKTHPFIEYLESLRDREDRGALAALRRGLGQPLGVVADMYRYVVPWLPASRHGEAGYYLVAALFAYHPAEGGAGNMGAHFATVRRQDPNADHTALERRFTALLAAHPDDLPTYLRQAVGFLRSRQPTVPINWHQLFFDLQRWGYDNRPVQKEWARAFWAGPSQTSEVSETSEV